MMYIEQRALDVPDPSTGRACGWTVQLGDGRRISWTGLQTGPLTFGRGEIDGICRRLLDHPLDQLPAHAGRVLRPATGEKAGLPALILHSTTPELRTFEGDLDALARQRPGNDPTTYKEARSVYLARPGDVVVGRTRAWRAAVEALGVPAIDLRHVDHYYLSHALLHLALEHQGGVRSPAIERMIARVGDTPRVVRLYAFETEMQIFLLWLARAAGTGELAVEANRPDLAAAWNRKSVLHPTVDQASRLDPGAAGETPLRCLELESRHSALALRLGIDLPAIPGYTLERQERSADDFVRQLLLAAALLEQRYGLTTGCLKASESGDGARITPGLDLADRSTLAALGREAHVHGDDYLLEAHVDYGRVSIGGQTLPSALSAHIRGGRVAPGATLQFMEGTSWKGNLLIDEATLDVAGVSTDCYRRLGRFVADFRRAVDGQTPGLVLAGIDFAIGRVGGAFGGDTLLGVQDLNVSFTGAECLRAFLDKGPRAHDGGAGQRYGVTRVYRPGPAADHAAFLRVTRTFDRAPVRADTVAAIPGRWAMVGISGADPRDAIDNLDHLEAALVAAGLVA